MSGQAAAKEIRKELKVNFPGVKFSVRSDYTSVNVAWRNGPTPKMIEAVIGKYEMGSFDGMRDLYVYDNLVKGLPQCRWVFANRSVDEAIQNKVRAEHAEYVGDWANLGPYEQDRRVNETLNNTVY